MKKIYLLIVTVVLLGLFFKLFSNSNERFQSVEQRYENSGAVNLTAEMDADRLSAILMNHSYVQTKEDAKFIANTLSKKLQENERPGALLELNKRIWQAKAAEIDSAGGEALRAKLLQSQINLGIDDDFATFEKGAWKNQGVDLKEKSGVIKVEVTNEDKACAGVAVRLCEEYVDTLNGAPAATRRVLAYLRTDNSGKVVFDGLDPQKSYSVLPIQKGYEYGSSRGTVGGTLEKKHKGKANFEFEEKEHLIRLFDETTLKQIKDEGTVTVRTPKEYKDELVWYVVLVLGAWWVLYITSVVRRKSIDETMLSVLMMLTGLSLLSMFSINDPLCDRLLGVDMGTGILVGIIVIFLLQFVNFKKFYQDRYLISFDAPMSILIWFFFKPYKQKVSRLSEVLTDKSKNVLIKCAALLIIVLTLPLMVLDVIGLTKLHDWVEQKADRLPRGIGYVCVALLLTFLLFPFGTSVGGMKVNLNFGFLFQPSEIAKYLFVISAAAYFSVKADSIVRYSAQGNLNLISSKLKMLSVVLICLLLLMGLYLVLGDMGPALVLAFTFIIIYSVIKSKIELEGQSDGVILKRIFTSDVAMLIYGVLSFVCCVLIGHYLDNLALFSGLWFVVWIVGGILRKQLFETPIVFNLIIVCFMFGSSLLGGGIGERLEARNEMCTNTWGVLPVDGVKGDPGANTQVAEGLWGLASGGIKGQGLGDGSPHFIPAFHTDMVLESIAEQMGFIGVFVIIVLFAILLRKTIVWGFRTAHPFLFFLCLGIAVVTGVQFLIISLGSLGIIPLTGVTVPFFSFGKVSVILNMFAFGVVLSIASHITEEYKKTSAEMIQMSQKNMEKYNYSISILSGVYSCVALFICGVFFYYQYVERDEILTKPVYVNSASGAPVLAYNPRIAQLTNKMYPGDIYDRNGVLLATRNKSKLKLHSTTYALSGVECDTSKVQRRYYPYGEHLYFMLGDFNSKLFFSSSDVSPRGYMAEARHLSDLRGFDNIKVDKNGKPVRVELKSSEWAPGKFHAADYSTSTGEIQVRDYSRLLPYLKAGLYSDVNAKFEGKDAGLWHVGDIRPKDVHMTLDAVLQTRLQDALAEYAKQNFNDAKWNKLRMSVVVLDGANGDMLASANYPLPDYVMLKNAPNVYEKVEKNQESNWKAYTDMDLGLVRATAPGSTAKVISAIAGLRKIGVDAANPELDDYYYDIDPVQKVGLEPTGRVTMRDAIVKSSNCYFINLINDHNVYDSLAYVYRTVGVNINGSSPYILNYNTYNPNTHWEAKVINQASGATTAYKNYIKKYRNIKDPRMNKHEAWWWVWGQGKMAATPLAMARVASIVGNYGSMPVTRFVLDSAKVSVPVITYAEAERLNEFMKEEAVVKKFTNANVGGKTGTAERILYIDNKVKKPHDGWFICFVENSRIKKNGQVYTAPLGVAVRLERLGSGMSDKAVDVTRDVVLEVLGELGYLQ